MYIPGKNPIGFLEDPYKILLDPLGIGSILELFNMAEWFLII